MESGVPQSGVLVLVLVPPRGGSNGDITTILSRRPVSLSGGPGTTTTTGTIGRVVRSTSGKTLSTGLGSSPFPPSLTNTRRGLLRFDVEDEDLRETRLLSQITTYETLYRSE